MEISKRNFVISTGQCPFKSPRSFSFIFAHGLSGNLEFTGAFFPDIEQNNEAAPASPNPSLGVSLTESYCSLGNSKVTLILHCSPIGSNRLQRTW